MFDHNTLRSQISIGSKVFNYYSLRKLEELGQVDLDRLPYSIRIILEGVVRKYGEKGVTFRDIENTASWKKVDNLRPVIPYIPSRVIMQDFTGVPAVVDLSAMRSAMQRLGGDPSKINPISPVDLVIDHSIQVDFYASPDALERNADIEFQRNRERYEFLRWGQKAFDNFRVVPPSTGIVHQINLEYLADVVSTRDTESGTIVFPDTLVGTDSHTTMINALGIVGWGVGGIEAEAVMLGQPIDILLPDVIGFKLNGALKPGVTATDLTLTITQILREKGVVGKFVEFFGSSLSSISLTDRATIANMAPEYGATMGFFPVDQETIRYLELTGRDKSHIELVKTYCNEQNLFRNDDSHEPEFTDIIELDLGSVQPSLAGPKRPQDRIDLCNMQVKFQTALTDPVSSGGYGLDANQINNKVKLSSNGVDRESGHEISHGVLAIASITSCTNTSNPYVMVGAGLLAKNALEMGLNVKRYVKTSLAPGSRVVVDYLEKSGLLDPLAELGFNVVGFGCTTCIGNSGPLSVEMVKALSNSGLISASVISGNRNFEGRVHPLVKASYLASPPLVVAYALAGTVDIDLQSQSIGIGKGGTPVFLSDIWPDPEEIRNIVETVIHPDIFKENYSDVFTGNQTWNQISADEEQIYGWTPDSTYIQEPPFFRELPRDVPEITSISSAKVLAVLGDSITTDHISPAGAIPSNSPAGRYLVTKGVKIREFNSFGSRRGNDRVMTRGTFGNIRLKNLMVPGVEGGYTIFQPDGEKMTIFDAAVKYREVGIQLVILAGKDYGTGSSRDWAAKGTKLLGVRAVIAESFERIHRSNLIGMGVLPLEFLNGDSAESLGLDGSEEISVKGIDDSIRPLKILNTNAKRQNGEIITFQVKARLDTPMEVEYFRHGGILDFVLREFLND